MTFEQALITHRLIPGSAYRVRENGEVEDVLYPPINYGDIAVEKLFNPEAKNRDTWQVNRSP